MGNRNSAEQGKPIGPSGASPVAENSPNPWSPLAEADRFSSLFNRPAGKCAVCVRRSGVELKHGDEDRCRKNTVVRTTDRGAALPSWPILLEGLALRSRGVAPSDLPRHLQTHGASVGHRPRGYFVLCYRLRPSDPGQLKRLVGLLIRSGSVEGGQLGLSRHSICP